MIFCPITERSLRVRLLYTAIYLCLSIGAVTMVAPFGLMVAGSLKPGARSGGASPAYLFRDSALWAHYLEAKYRGRTELFRMAWSEANAEFAAPPQAPASTPLALWDAYLAAHPAPERLLAVGFSDGRASTPSATNRAFQQWLRQRTGSSITKLNAELETTFGAFHAIVPPNTSLVGAALPASPFRDLFEDFARTHVPPQQRFVWDAGGYYRAVFLPRLIGPEIASFNRKYGTAYTSYTEVPFPTTVPTVAADAWGTFTTRMLRPDFVELTPEGEARRHSLGIGHGEFIRHSARPAELRVATLDRLFADWAHATHGVEDARIPQAALDHRALEAGKAAWRWTFLTQNYRYVLDAVFFYGNAFRNTVILVVLMIVGTLLVNSLAAYALSRYKLRQTYALLLIFLATLAFPGEVTMIPVFLQLKELGLLNTFAALVLPGLVNGFSIFLLKGFFDSLPRELYEAAEIDGAGEWRMFWLITMNLSKPILAVMALSAFVSAYGAFFYALILAPDPRMWTIMVHIYQLQQSAGTPVIYASLILTAIPTLLVFILCQKIILRGIVIPTEK